MEPPSGLKRSDCESVPTIGGIEDPFSDDEQSWPSVPTTGRQGSSGVPTDHSHLLHGHTSLGASQAPNSAYTMPLSTEVIYHVALTEVALVGRTERGLG